MNVSKICPLSAIVEPQPPLSTTTSPLTGGDQSDFPTFHVLEVLAHLRLSGLADKTQTQN